MTDSSADMSAIVERLDRLEKVLVRLCEAVEARSGAAVPEKAAEVRATTPPPVQAEAVAATPAPAPAPAAVVPKPAAPKPVPAAAPVLGTHERPTSVQVALPSARPKMPSGPLPSAAPLLTEEQARALAAKELDLSPFIPSDDADPTAIIGTLFKFSLQKPDMGNPLMLALFHSDVISAPRSPEHLKAFNFPKLRRNIQLYLTDANPESYVLVRSEVDDAQQSVKVFLHRIGGMPAPVRLKRDPLANDAWRIVQMSL